jgi:hypothetical protein
MHYLKSLLFVFALATAFTSASPSPQDDVQGDDVQGDDVQGVGTEVSFVILLFKRSC